MKQLKNVHCNFKVLPFWSQQRYMYNDQSKIKGSFYHKNQILKPSGEWQLSLPHSGPPENCHFRVKNEIFYSFLHTTVYDSGCFIHTSAYSNYVVVLFEEFSCCVLHKTYKKVKMQSDKIKSRDSTLFGIF